MTNEKFVTSILLTIGALVTWTTLAIICKVHFKSEEVYGIIKDFSPVLISTAAAYLAYCFQRRQAFLISLRDLWKEMVEAKTVLIQFTHNPMPDQSAFDATQKSLSKAIDLVRGVYKNVGESERQIGLYPFEPLHDMRKSLNYLGSKVVTAHQRLTARREILSSWNALRYVFFKGILDA